MKDLRDKIAEIICSHRFYRAFTNDKKSSYEIADQILALLSSLEGVKLIKESEMKVKKVTCNKGGKT